MTTNQTSGERIELILKAFNIKQVALSQRLGVTRAYVSNLVNDRVPLTTTVLLGLLKSFARLNAHWVLTGEGEMLFPETKEVIAQEPTPKYKKATIDPLVELRLKLEQYEARIKVLEAGYLELESVKALLNKWDSEGNT